jgi:hypothetical protein
VAIVFKDLQMLVSYSRKENTTKELFHRQRGKPFWIGILTNISKKILKQTEIAALITLLVYLLKKEWKKQFILTNESDFFDISNLLVLPTAKAKLHPLPHEANI